ncbi:DNA polymerase I [Paenibacillus aceris]|uniref:DNA polymerase I n=1 Tax=Paenibacillus aceris TaxID=869555 RepID=A0ABS4HZH5_9BACL|nr:DNA polymerase I [Paenibacillus aceris]MBP1963576.1 DNA polymerase-1 [Paenibacillus aceris]NHW36840.1 DNA polymerase I [Paenibacillus aceris]
MDKLIIIDGNSIANRAFYALPLLSNSSGLHTNAVYGFTTMLLKLIEEEKPTHFLVAFDAGKITFRHKEYTEYKGGRAKTPSELSEQFPLIKELLKAFKIPQFELSGYEADDIIGTLTKAADAKGEKVLLVSGDKDMLQLASDHVTVAITRKGITEVELYNPAEIKEKYGLTPAQIIDLKGLMGDTSDNIPGIPGVGEKTALKMLHEFGTVEEVLANTASLKGKMKEKVEEHAKDAIMSKELATIFREVPMETEWDTFRYDGFDGQALAGMFRKLEFKSLLEKMDFGTVDLEAAGQVVESMDAVVVTEANIGELINKLSDSAAIHVEAVGENPHQAVNVGVIWFTHEGDINTSYYVPFELLKGEAGEPLRAWLADDTKKKQLFDLHRSILALAWQGIALKGVDFDVLLAAYLLDPTESNLSLSGLSAKYSLPGLKADEDVFGKGAKFRLPELAALSDHLGRKAMATARLVPALAEELEKGEMHSLFYELEQPLASVLAEMELRGIAVDAEGLKALGVDLVKQLDAIMTSIYTLAGVEFNINSPKQLGEILFEKLGLPAWKKTKTGYSTDAEVLERLAPYNEVVGQILHYRQLAKLQSTYVEGLLKEVRPETGKVHTYYRQTIAATGRLSSQFPNLQNIPIRLEEGRKIRKVFVPSEPGWYILAADYSQIELRVLAHISQDEKLKEAFLQNMDIHTKTAMDVFGVEESAVDSNMRRQAKAVNFGIVYGISGYGLSQNLDITRGEAERFIEQYFAVFQGVRKYMDVIVEDAREKGYVTTLLQRRRYLPEITHSNFNLRSFAERTAMNTPIQGTAADIIKLAMVQMAARLKQEGLKSRMLLQVHDELVFEVPEEELETMRRLVPEVMAGALKLDVPLSADVDFGLTWYDAK